MCVCVCVCVCVCICVVVWLLLQKSVWSYRTITCDPQTNELTCDVNTYVCVCFLSPSENRAIKIAHNLGTLCDTIRVHGMKAMRCRRHSAARCMWHQGEVVMGAYDGSDGSNDALHTHLYRCCCFCFPYCGCFSHTMSRFVRLHAHISVTLGCASVFVISLVVLATIGATNAARIYMLGEQVRGVCARDRVVA